MNARKIALGLWCCALVACGGPPPAVPDAPAPAPTSASSSAGALPDDAKGEASAETSGEKSGTDPALASAPRIGPYAHLWTAETKDWNGGLLLTRDGDLLSFSSRTIRVHARDDGRVLHQATGCGPVSENAVAFVGDDRFVAACSGELREYSWPKLGSKPIVSFAKRVDQASVVGGLAAVAEDGFFAPDKKGRVVVYRVADGSVVDELVPPAEVETLALSPDGAQLLIGMRDAIVLRDLRAKRTDAWSEKTDADGAEFSPDGKAIFGDFSSFEATIIDLAGHRRRKSWRVGSWITASRWVDPGTIVATGSDGLTLFGADAKPVPSPVGQLGEGIALSKDGATLCAGGRGGRIACFGKAKPAPTTIAAAFAGSGRPDAPSDAGGDRAAPKGPEIEAKILGRKGDLLEVTVDPSVTLEVGSTGTVSKPFQTNLPIPISGWIVIAEVKVTKTSAGKATLAIVATKSAMTMNGRPVNHFAPGPARLSLSPPP